MWSEGQTFCSLHKSFKIPYSVTTRCVGGQNFLYVRPAVGSPPVPPQTRTPLHSLQRYCAHVYVGTVKFVYSDTPVATRICCYNQVVVVTRTFSTETIDSVPAMCVVVKRLML